MSNLGEYVKKAKEGKTDLTEVMEKRKQTKLAELEEVQLEAMISEAKKKIQDSQTFQQPLQPIQAQTFAQLLLAGRKPEEVTQILDSLSPEHIEKLVLITSAMNSNQLSTVTQLLRKPETDVKETIELINTIVKLNQQQSGGGNVETIAKSMAEMFKTGVELGKSQSSKSQEQNPIETLKMYHETFIKPLLDQGTQKDKEIWDMRFKELESRQVNPIEYLLQIKKMAGELGLSPAGTNEMDLKKLEMQQNKELDDRRITWEEKKWEMQQEKDAKMVDTIVGAVKEIGGPLAKNLGGAAADRIRGGSTTPQLSRAQCPNCKGVFQVNPSLSTVQCPLCGVTLSSQPQQPQQQQVTEAQQPVAEPTSQQEPQPTQ